LIYFTTTITVADVNITIRTGISYVNGSGTTTAAAASPRIKMN